MSHDDQDPPQRITRKIWDNARNYTFNRGAEKTSWEDIWLGVTDISSLSDVMRKRGIDIDDLREDLKYVSHFDTLKGVVAHEESMNIKLARQELLEAMTEFKKIFMAELGDSITPIFLSVNEEEKEILKSHFNKLLQSFIKSVYGAITKATETVDKRRIEIKSQIISKITAETMNKLNLAQKVIDTNGFNEELQQTIDGIFKGLAITEELSPQIILSHMESKEEMEKTPISPLDVIIMIKDFSGHFYHQLFLRNGEYTKSKEEQDLVSELLPKRAAQKIALKSLNHAYTVKSPELDERHIIMTLLDHWEVQKHLSALKIPDLMDFREKFFNSAFKKEIAKGDKINRHPEITEDSSDHLTMVNSFYADHKDDEHAASRLLQEMISNSPDARKHLTEAGITQKMLDGWNKPYNEKASKKEKKKDKKSYKVSDEELNELIKTYCIDYTDLARKKKFDPMVGREDVLSEMETTLLKKGKKNPAIIGEPGIGKTKVLEGISQKIVSGKIHDKFIGSRLLYLDMQSMNDSPYRGVFEKRLKTLLDGISERNASSDQPPVIIAIDELAGTKNAGSHTHSDGAQSLLKPYLAGGDLLVIGATTEKEFQTKIETDEAFARRFNKISVSEPSAEETLEILKGIKIKYSQHHGLRIKETLLKDIVKTTENHVHGRNHPDKDIDLLDHACAIAVQSGSKSLRKEHIIKAVSSAGNVPEAFLQTDTNERYAALPDTLAKTILEQDPAILALSSAIQRSKLGLKDTEKPVGTFIFVGPTGVGKTELTKCLTSTLHGNEDSLIRFDMSEYMEKHNASRLIGSPPGYIGYDAGGSLVNAVKRKPHSVLLFDEIEKAHPDVFNLLLGPFSNGMVTDGRGINANMRNTINIMTSNLGAREVFATGQKAGLDPLKDTEAWNEMAMPIYNAAIKNFFAPEFLNRIDEVICFNTLSYETITSLADRQIEITSKQLKNGPLGTGIKVCDDLRQQTIKKGFDIRYGARHLGRVWNKTVVDPLAAWILRQPPKELKKAANIKISSNGTATPNFTFEM